MFTINNKTVLITGAAMGMGKLYALKAAQEKAKQIILWDIQENQLRETINLLESKGANVAGTVVDLSQLESIKEVALATKSLPGFSGIDVLINNAGVISGNQFFWKLDEKKDIDSTMAINALAPMYVTLQFIEEMIADTTKEKCILNVASAAGLVSNPNMSVYAASKWAALGWSDSLRLELKKSGYSHMRVTTFCPTYISTGMFAGAKSMLLMPIVTPESAVDTAWSAMKRGKAIVYKPFTVSLSGLVKGILPLPIWDWVAEHILRIYNSMDNFTGRPH